MAFVVGHAMMSERLQCCFWGCCIKFGLRLVVIPATANMSVTGQSEESLDADQIIQV